MVYQIILNTPSTYVAGIYFLERRTLKNLMMNTVRESEQDLITTSSSEDLGEVQSLSGLCRSIECTIGECDNNLLMPTRRVSFPKKDSDLVTGYLEPVNPWESVAVVRTPAELEQLYKHSCVKHNTDPLKLVLDHLQSLDLQGALRQTALNLKDTKLTPESCEALEEIIKRVQYQSINVNNCHLNDTAASALFQMIEFYEAANELDISYNPQITQNGWECLIGMIKKTASLQTLIACGLSPLSDKNASNLGKSVSCSNLHTLKLEHCGLTGKPIISLCIALRKSKALKELWIAHNDLNSVDADMLAELLKVNPYLQFLDISNNHIKDDGVKSIVTALIKQSSEKSFFPDKFLDDKKLFDKPPAVQAPSGRSMLNVLLTGNNIESTKDSYTNLNAPETKPIKDNKINDDILVGPKETFADENDDNKIQTKEPNTNLILKNVEPYANAVPNNQNDQKEILANNNISTDIKNYEIEKNISADNECTSICDLNKNEEEKELKTINSELNIESTDNCQPPNEFETEKVQTRSHSSDSISSENSVDMTESNLSAVVNEKLTKNDTLGRQKSTFETFETYKTPRGLQALILWNNNITRISGEYIGDLLAVSNSLELLNIGKNILSNEFIEKIASSLKVNKILTSLGLQSAHLSCAGIVALSNILQGGNCSLQRIDIRDNNIQILGMKTLTDALKSNNSVTRIDIDDEPKRLEIDNAEFKTTYMKYLCTIRGHCSKNLTPLEAPSLCANLKKLNQYTNSRKISLTCQSFHSPISDGALRSDNILGSDKKKTNTKLRSPLPSPPISSPSSSPVPSPSRNRFQVIRVIEYDKNPPSPKENPCISSISNFHITVVPDSDVNSKINHTAEIKSEKLVTNSTQKPPTIVHASENMEKIDAINNSSCAKDTSQPIVQSQPDQNLSSSTNFDFKNTTENKIQKPSWISNPAVDKFFNFLNTFTTTEKEVNSDVASSSGKDLSNITEASNVTEVTSSKLFDYASRIKEFSKTVLKPNERQCDLSGTQNTDTDVSLLNNVNTLPNINICASPSQNENNIIENKDDIMENDEKDKENKEDAMGDEENLI